MIDIARVSSVTIASVFGMPASVSWIAGVPLSSFRAGQSKGVDFVASGSTGFAVKAILRFLAMEIIESDLWLQYQELGGVQDHEVTKLASKLIGIPSRPPKETLRHVAMYSRQHGG